MSDTLLENSRNGDYRTVFFLEQFPIYEMTDIRKEHLKEAKRISYLLGRVYRMLNYDVVDVPSMGPAGRSAKYIMDMINRI